MKHLAMMLALVLAFGSAAGAQGTGELPAQANKGVTDQPLDRPQSSSDPKPSDDQKKATPQTGPTAVSPVILDHTQAPQQEDAARRGEAGSDGVRAKPLVHEDAEATIANFTIALAVATIVLSLSTIFLWWETRKLAGYAKLQAEDTKKSIEIAEKAAQAAVVTASSTRAWMTFGGIQPGLVADIILDGSHLGPGIMVAFQFNNTGSSPAINLLGMSQFKFLQINDEIPTFPVEDFIGENHKTVVGPNTNTSLGPLGATHGQLALIEQGTHKLIFWTKISYNDIYNPLTEHETQTCSSIRVNGMQTLPNGTQVPNLMITPIGMQNTCT